jgi:FKBP-type peptidyl-prolyl cis-trans isomerase FkpA
MRSMLSRVAPTFRALSRHVVVLSGAMAFAACSGGDSTAVANIPSNPAVETYAPATGVVIANMTRVSNDLFIQDIPAGTGTEATAGRTVDVRYTGYLTNGTIFDSNAAASRPILTFTLGAGQVISGWDQGLIGMRVGGRRRLVIGSTLAYQNRSPNPNTIPQNSTLVFDVTLVAVR